MQPQPATFTARKYQVQISSQNSEVKLAEGEQSCRVYVVMWFTNFV